MDQKPKKKLNRIRGVLLRNPLLICQLHPVLLMENLKGGMWIFGPMHYADLPVFKSFRAA